MTDFAQIVGILAGLVGVGIFLFVKLLDRRSSRKNSGPDEVAAMPDVKAIVENSPLLPIYLHELWGLSKSIQSNCEELFAEAPASIPDDNGNPSGYIKVSAELLSHIREALSSAHVIRNLLDDGPKRNNESQRSSMARQTRAQMLREELKDVDLQPLLNSSVRNSLEHMEERIDQTVLRHADGKIKEPAALFNIALSSRTMIRPEPFFLRVYVADEKTYHNAGSSINIEKMYETACVVVEKIEAVLGAEDGDAPGGLILRFQ